MAGSEIVDVSAQPYFELEDFMNFARETRIASETLAQLENMFNRWTGLLKARKIMAGDKSWLILWMPEEVEAEIDALWQNAPSAGFLSNQLAQYMCLTAIQDLLPQTVETGCAPLPELTLSLRSALQELELLPENGGTLNRRFAILTHYPFGGGCKKCALAPDCPKMKGIPDLPTWVLPGHEKNALA